MAPSLTIPVALARRSDCAPSSWACTSSSQPPTCTVAPQHAAPRPEPEPDPCSELLARAAAWRLSEDYYDVPRNVIPVYAAALHPHSRVLAVQGFLLCVCAFVVCAIATRSVFSPRMTKCARRWDTVRGSHSCFAYIARRTVRARLRPVSDPKVRTHSKRRHIDMKTMLQHRTQKGVHARSKAHQTARGALRGL